MVLYMPRNGITNLWGEDPIAILNPRNVRKANVSCVFDEKNYFERRPTSD